MKESIFFEIHDNLSRAGYGRDKYTRKAFGMIPKLRKPSILDVGCGPGAPTLELARLTTGKIIGVDTYQPYLERLAEKAQRLGFSHHITTINCSMLDPEETTSETLLVE
jgi:ubiquinone/menaquinone biosynthesis C-methylase UbiE